MRRRSAGAPKQQWRLGSGAISVEQNFTLHTNNELAQALLPAFADLRMFTLRVLGREQ
jgi:hypothetical protein